jgi:hypothetical protein
MKNNLSQCIVIPVVKLTLQQCVCIISKLILIPLSYENHKEGIEIGGLHLPHLDHNFSPLNSNCKDLGNRNSASIECSA